jgi:hypothetical protein
MICPSCDTVAKIIMTGLKFIHLTFCFEIDLWGQLYFVPPHEWQKLLKEKRRIYAHEPTGNIRK